MRISRTLLLMVLGSFALFSFTTTAASGGSSSRPVKVRVILAQNRAVAGHPIKGTVVLINTTARHITVDTCAANGWLAVGLHGV
jgi:hypothetical protein